MWEKIKEFFKPRNCISDMDLIKRVYNSEITKKERECYKIMFEQVGHFVFSDMGYYNDENIRRQKILERYNFKTKLVPYGAVEERKLFKNNMLNVTEVAFGNEL